MFFHFDSAVSSSHDCSGVPAYDVVTWMKDLKLRAVQAGEKSSGPSFWQVPPCLSCELGAGGSLALDDGAAVACVYLEYLVSAGEDSPMLHNELGYLLLDGLKRIGGSDHESSSIYRQWLRTFLMRSKNYDAKAQLSWLPETFLHERALVLARMQNHKAVLKIYAISLRDDKLAEDYCENIWGEATQSRDTRLVTEPHNPEILSNTASDVYTTLANIYASQLVIQHSTTDATLPCAVALGKALGFMHRNLNRLHPAKVLNALPVDLSLSCYAKFTEALIRSSESERRAALVQHNLRRVEFVNLKYELTRQQIKQQSTMSAVPELASLGRVKRSLTPVVLSECAEGGEAYHVSCTRHALDSHVVLQFHVTNNARGQQLQNVRVRVEPLGDADLYAHHAEVPLQILPFESTGSCYVVFRTYPAVGIVSSLFACELRFVVVDPGDLNVSGAYLEEILLQNLELPASEL